MIILLAGVVFADDLQLWNPSGGDLQGTDGKGITQQQTGHIFLGQISPVTTSTTATTTTTTTTIPTGNSYIYQLSKWTRP